MSTAAHRRPRTATLRRRAGGVTLAGAVASVGTLTMTAPAAQADSHNVWDRVADCESSGRWDINSGNGYYGGLQFWHPTWTSFGGGEFAAYAHQATKVQQVTVAQRVLKVQGPGAWPVCSVRAGLTMENGSAPYGGGSPAPAPAPAPQPPAPAPAPPAASGTFTVTAPAGANIRSGPSTSFGVVGGAGFGAKLQGSISTNGWLKLSDGRGWVSGTIVAPANGSPAPAPAPAPGPAPVPAPAPAPPAASGTYTVTAKAGANIRSGPSTAHAVVGGAAFQAKLQGSISTGGWLKLSNGRGWISGTIVAPVTSAAPAPGVAPSTGAMSPLTLDGSRGPLTVKAIQRWAGVSETGAWNTTTIKALQRTVGTSADGSWGPASQAALQTRIGISRDGSTYMNHRTIVALQQFLNANVIR